MKNADFIFKNALVLTIDSDFNQFYPGAVVVTGNQITAVGPEDDILQNFSSIETVDCQGKVIMPGLINGHTHVPMNLLRGLADDLRLDVVGGGHLDVGQTPRLEVFQVRGLPGPVMPLHAFVEQHGAALKLRFRLERTQAHQEVGSRRRRLPRGLTLHPPRVHGRPAHDLPTPLHGLSGLTQQRPQRHHRRRPAPGGLGVAHVQEETRRVKVTRLPVRTRHTDRKTGRGGA